MHALYNHFLKLIYIFFKQSKSVAKRHAILQEATLKYRAQTEAKRAAAAAEKVPPETAAEDGDALNDSAFLDFKHVLEEVEHTMADPPDIDPNAFFNVDTFYTIIT